MRDAARGISALELGLLSAVTIAIAASDCLAAPCTEGEEERAIGASELRQGLVGSATSLPRLPAGPTAFASCLRESARAALRRESRKPRRVHSAMVATAAANVPGDDDDADDGDDARSSSSFSGSSLAGGGGEEGSSCLGEGGGLMALRSFVDGVLLLIVMKGDGIIDAAFEEDGFAQKQRSADEGGCCDRAAIGR